MSASTTVIEAQTPAASGGPGGAARGRGFGQIPPPGPPAPVPPEVAIERPSTDEVTKMNHELARLVQADSSSVKPLLEKYKSLVHITPPRPNVAATYTMLGVCAPRHEAFVEQGKKGNVDILFEGDSIIDWWTRNGAEAFKKYFGDEKIVNFAVAGDTT